MLLVVGPMHLFGLGACTSEKLISSESDYDVIGVLWWPADSAMDGYSFAGRMETCITRVITQESPQTDVVSSELVRNRLYPLMEPQTQPRSEAGFGELLRREDVRDRLSAEGITHLVAFTGRTNVGDWKGGILCGVGYGGGGCLGFSWTDKSTALEAALWDLRNNGKLNSVAVETKGTSVVPALGLPIPLPARTEGAACRKLAQSVLTAIKDHR